MSVTQKAANKTLGNTAGMGGAKLTTASSEQLEAWGEKILEADSLEAVFE